MGESCPACKSELTNPNTQNYCGSCGEPINIEVDRERIRRQTSGFLERSERGRILNTVAESRGRHHEYTHVKVQEEVRHAMMDFWLLTEWEQFDTHAAAIGDIGRKGTESLSEDDDLLDIRSIIGFLNFVFSSLNMRVISYCLESHLQDLVEEVGEIDSDEVPEFDVEIRATSDHLDEPLLLNEKA